MGFLNHFWDSVWPNLAANIIWGAPALWMYYIKLKRHHRHLIDELHERLTGIEESQATTMGFVDPGHPTRAQDVLPLIQKEIG